MSAKESFLSLSVKKSAAMCESPITEILRPCLSLIFRLMLRNPENSSSSSSSATTSARFCLLSAIPFGMTKPFGSPATQQSAS